MRSSEETQDSMTENKDVMTKDDMRRRMKIEGGNIHQLRNINQIIMRRKKKRKKDQGKMKRSTARKSMKKSRRRAKKNPARKKPQLKSGRSELSTVTTAEVFITMPRIAFTSQKLAMKDNSQEIHHMTGMKKGVAIRRVAEARRKNTKKEDTTAHQVLQAHLIERVIARDMRPSTGSTKKGASR